MLLFSISRALGTEGEQLNANKSLSCKRKRKGSFEDAALTNSGSINRVGFNSTCLFGKS